MHIRKISLVLFISFISTSIFANDKGIEVVGKAAIQAVPDEFSITLEIKQRGVVASKAKKVVDHKSELLMRELNKIGFDNKAIDSLDPRIARANLSGGNSSDMENLLHFQTYEVFHQKKRGAQHQHVGIVHAPNPDMALLYAKEQYARREQTSKRTQPLQNQKVLCEGREPHSPPQTSNARQL